MSTRVKGHAMAHLAWRPRAGWAWQCQCGFRPVAYCDTKSEARREHLEHKERIGTPREHGGIQWYPARPSGLRARCLCGHDYGPSVAMDADWAIHDEHRAAVSTLTDSEKGA
ncbi:MAG: hypothetical protein ABWY57_15070 [Mycetocola sp.]